jgi:pimeloyl-ACP methyl ester carboxylesterase
MNINANGINIEVEDSGPDPSGQARPAVLLIMGLGLQLVAWPVAFVQALLDAGYRVIRLDNRDVGLSEKLDHLGKPNLLWASLKYKLGLRVSAPYCLGDMANDALAVLDALQIDKAHVVGVSMGGMIAQRAALSAPQRLLSLTSIMSSSGARGLPPAEPEVMRLLLRSPGSTPEAALQHYVQLFQAIGSPGFPVTEGDLRKMISSAAERSFHPVGTLRQMMAIIADTNRAAELASLRLPTLVLHGKKDPLVPYACGEDTARRIPGATLVGIEGMGHDLPPGVLPQLLAPLLPHLKTAQLP